MIWHQLFQENLPSLGFGGVAGLVVGYAAKKVTKMVAIGLGLFFVCIQVMAYYGYVTVNWGVFESQAQGWLMDMHGLTFADRLWRVLTSNLPFGSAFTAGFVIGVNKG